jgi:antirestriction protein ArdC
MFRQVIVCQWAQGASPEAKQAYRDALDGLRAIPELLAMRWGDDAGHFEGNFDFVVVADFADFASARRYVAHPLHQAYVRDHASKTIGQRIVVQHDWIAPDAS